MLFSRISTTVATAALVTLSSATPILSHASHHAAHAVRAAACPVNEATVNMIAHSEGERFTTYADQRGDLTIGIGHKCVQPQCAEVPYSIPLNSDTTRKLLHSDLERFERAVSTGLAGVSLNGNQYGAVVSVAFNGGEFAPALQEFYAAMKTAQPAGYAGIFERVLGAHNLGVADVSARRGTELTLFKTPTTQKGFPC